MATTLQQDIRASLLKYNELIKFSYGRSLDNALNSVKLEIDNYLVCLDPPTYSGGLIDANETKTISLSWLKKDNVDSVSDEAHNIAGVQSMEEIVKECHDHCITWLKGFADEYYKKYTIDAYTGFEAFRVKDILTGFVITLNVSSKLPC